MLHEDNQASQSNPENPSEKDQVESHSVAASGANPSELNGCLKIASNRSSSGAFNDIIDSEFSRPLLDSPAPPTLSFMNQSTPQS